MGPGARPAQLDRFRLPGVAIEVCPGFDYGPGFDAALVLGGDGTINRHLGPLAQFGLPFLPVPSGSGNDFARGVGIGSRGDAERVWRQFVATRATRPVDLGWISSRERDKERYATFCSVGGIGLSAEANRRANAMPAWLRGHGGYALAAVASLPRLKTPELTVQSEGEVLWSGRAAAVVFANTAAFGQGMRVAPKAHAGDGLIDLCIVAAMPRLRIAALLPSVFFGRHLGIRGVTYLQRACFAIRCAEPLPAYADGELAGKGTDFTVFLKPGGLRVIA